MPVRNSEMVNQRVDLGKDLKAGIETYAPEIAEGYGKFLASVVAEGETALDVHYQLVLIGRCFDHEIHQLVQADLGVVGQVLDNDTVRFDVNRLRDAFDVKLRAVRHTTRGIFGLENLARVGLKGRFPTRPFALYERGRLVQTSLRNPDLGMVPLLDFSDDEDKAITAEVLADRLEPELTNLGRFVDTRYKDVRENADLRLRRQQAIRTFDGNIAGLVRMTQGMFRLAGRPDLAARFRTTLRRFRRLQRQPVEEGNENDQGAVSETTAS